MILNKKSLKADQIANLYRAAFSLAIGDQTTAVNFLRQSTNPAMIKSFQQKLEKKQQLFLAEKILDQYHQALLS